MPRYEFECLGCGGINAELRSLAGFTRESECPLCGEASRLIISKPASVAPEMATYVDEHLGDTPVRVEGRQHRKALMKERGLEEFVRRKPGMPGQWV